jgi:hypothetical protein
MVVLSLQLFSEEEVCQTPHVYLYLANGIDTVKNRRKTDKH